MSCLKLKIPVLRMLVSNLVCFIWSQKQKFSLLISGDAEKIRSPVPLENVQWTDFRIMDVFYLFPTFDEVCCLHILHTVRRNAVLELYLPGDVQLFHCCTGS